MKSYAYGFPRLGKNREFKKLLEGFWKGEMSEVTFRENLSHLESVRRVTYGKYVEFFPSGELSLYDPMLDMALLWGVYDARDLGEYFDLCRGRGALELTKWFNTNYHYLVPDFGRGSRNFRISDSPWKLHSKGVDHAYLIAPFTFLKLSKGIDNGEFEGMLDELVSLYVEYIGKMEFGSVHLEDPALVLPLSEDEWRMVRKVYEKFEVPVPTYLITYYDSVDRLDILMELPFSGIGVDLVHDGGRNRESLMKLDWNGKKIILGVVDGRNVWKSDLISVADDLQSLMNKGDIWISNGAPLYHLPVSVVGAGVDESLADRLAFAEERLRELNLLAGYVNGEVSGEELRGWLGQLNDSQQGKPSGNVMEHPGSEDFIRTPSYEERERIQREFFNFPRFPTTTIGSFPQTDDVRRIRLKRKRVEISEEDYRLFVKGEIAKAIEIQEELGLDVLVHGEFERSDMVEFFAEKLQGIATTGNGWIISYGTRCYRPPIIYGDVKRVEPLTLDEIRFAASLTDRPVKGMLTGPVTILAWSYVRNDVSEEEVAYQIAMALREEIRDYEKSGIKIIQIDEPAFKEKAPLKREEWKDYFRWAVRAFNLTCSHVEATTQIHTHMCYSEFGDIIDYIRQLEFDVISIETSRSGGDLIEAFERVEFNKQIGLGVWDIHSPHVPDVEEMRAIIERARRVLSPEQLWINPDCGLKTRRWEEIIPSLRNMVKLADDVRGE